VRFNKTLHLFGEIVKESLDTIKLAAWVLIVIGILETIFFAYAIMSGESFSGGAFLYIVAGIFLFKKNKRVYKFLLFMFTTFLSLILAGIVLFGMMTAQIYFATDIPISWKGSSLYSLVFVFYIGLMIVLVALLHHPNTRHALSLKSYEATVHTLYMSRLRVGAVLGISVVFAALLVGPHVLHNPYKQIVAEIKKDALIADNVGEVQRLELIYTGEHNWHIYSDWRIIGTKGEGEYRVILSPRSHLTIESSRKAQRDA